MGEWFVFALSFLTGEDQWRSVFGTWEFRPEAWEDAITVLQGLPLSAQQFSSGAPLTQGSPTPQEWVFYIFNFFICI